MIKPGDVTPELAKALLGWTSIIPRQARQKVADMANAMIEAGLVSPPSCCGRLQSVGNRAMGPVLKLDTGEVILWAPESKPINVVLEHWKGQTS